MAYLNGRLVWIRGKSPNEIGKLLVLSSPNRDGQGIKLKLTPSEAELINVLFPDNIAAYSLIKILVQALERERLPYHHLSFSYMFKTRTLTTD